MSHDTQRATSSLIEIVAGFSAGLASTFVAHPFDIVKTRLQLESNVSSRVGNSLSTIRRIATTEGGFRAFYRGLTPNLVGNSTSWACYFVCYENLKQAIVTVKGVQASLGYHDYFVASATAGKYYKIDVHVFADGGLRGTGALTAVITNPIWVIKTRMLSTSSSHPGAYQSMIHGTRQIYKSEGWRGFYRGLVPSMFGVSHGALQFMAYELLKKERGKQSPRHDLTTTDYLLLSGTAKIFAGSITYPYQLVRARLQMYNADGVYRGVVDVVGRVWSEEGLVGFYKGLGPNLLRVLPSTWVTFLVYEKMRLYLNTESGA